MSEKTPGASLQQALIQTKATRLAHFTPARNLYHILQDGAIRSSKDLADGAPDHFDPTDRERFDRNPDKICCTFQFPNGYYLAQARSKPDFQNYPDWVCLFLDVDLALRPGTLFAPCNAAKQNGTLLKPGAPALLDCFAATSDGWTRGSRHLPGAATNLQAEVLVPGPIDLRHVQAVTVPSMEAAETEWARLTMLNADPGRFSWAVSSVLFDRNELSNRVRYGRPFQEIPWIPPRDGASHDKVH
ncbi:DarT ssDNA thymidine ADP-ribosyltransferase family protein [Streptomyces venezuelae]|uniref:DarT ssDNA thymidine ADP-ribosyltransferase family protein n=1 Tax=Streptomyces venezuelae TaxID=54571 RepID=UPI0037B024A3